MTTEKNKKIKGGYYIKARKIQESEIAHAPPHVREIWDWLIKEANWKPHTVGGKTIKRGQVLTTYKDIQEGLHWKVGWRKEVYSKWDCEKAMKVLKKATMVTTEKTTRGMIVTIINYETYQDAENYESHKEDHRTTTREPQTTDTIRKEEEEKEEIKTTFSLTRVREEVSGEGENTIVHRRKYIPAKIQKCIPPELNNVEFIRVWNLEWVPFRKGRNLPSYVVPAGLKATLSGLRNKCGGDSAAAIAAIRYSIEMNWQGIFPDRMPKGVNGSSRAKSKPAHGTHKKGKYETNAKETKI